MHTLFFSGKREPKGILGKCRRS